MKRLLIVITASFFLVSCGLNSRYAQTYNKIKVNFDKELLDHFPEDVQATYSFKSTFPAGARYANRCGVMLVTRTPRDIEMLKAGLDSVSIMITKPSDKCLLIVDQYDDEVSGGVFLEHLLKYCSDLYSPVPNFTKILKSESDIIITSEGRISDDFTLYLLDAKKGEFLDKDQLSYGYGLPKEWKNGYSKGVAISDKKIIYWLEIW